MSSVPLEDLEKRAEEGNLFCVDAVICLLGLVPNEESGVRDTIMNASRQTIHLDSREEGLTLIVETAGRYMKTQPGWLTSDLQSKLERFVKAVRKMVRHLEFQRISTPPSGLAVMLANRRSKGRRPVG